MYELPNARIRNVHGPASPAYRGTLLIRDSAPLGPYCRPMPRVLGRSQGGGLFLMCEVPISCSPTIFIRNIQVKEWA